MLYTSDIEHAYDIVLHAEHLKVKLNLTLICVY